MKTLVKTNNPFFNSLPSLLDDIFSVDSSRKKPNYGFLTQPKVNITENKDNFVLEFFVSGIVKDDLTITIEDETLAVGYKHKVTETKNDETVTRKEYRLQTFNRKFTLSKEIDKENVSAKHENGVLTITLQKVQKETPKSAKIEIK